MAIEMTNPYRSSTEDHLLSVGPAFSEFVPSDKATQVRG